MKATTAAAATLLVGAMILGGCAARRRGMYNWGATMKPSLENIDAALRGIDLPKFRPYGEYTSIQTSKNVVSLMRTSLG